MQRVNAAILCHDSVRNESPLENAAGRNLGCIPGNTSSLLQKLLLFLPQALSLRACVEKYRDRKSNNPRRNSGRGAGTLLCSATFCSITERPAVLPMFEMLLLRRASSKSDVCALLRFINSTDIQSAASSTYKRREWSFLLPLHFRVRLLRIRRSALKNFATSPATSRRTSSMAERGRVQSVNARAGRLRNANEIQKCLRADVSGGCPVFLRPPALLAPNSHFSSGKINSSNNRAARGG